jgi:hypothetical protein
MIVLVSIPPFKLGNKVFDVTITGASVVTVVIEAI